MVVREFLIEQLMEDLNNDDATVLYHCLNGAETECGLAAALKSDAVAILDQVYNMVETSMQNDPKRLLPAGGISTKRQKDMLEGWVQQVESWGNLPELTYEIRNALTTIDTNADLIDFYYPQKSKQKRRLGENLSLLWVSTHLGAFKIKYPHFWAAAILTECGHPLESLNLNPGEFIKAFKAQDDTLKRRVEDRVRKIANRLRKDMRQNRKK